MEAHDSKVTQNTEETVKENGHFNKGNEDKFVLTVYAFSACLIQRATSATSEPEVMYRCSRKR